MVTERRIKFRKGLSSLYLPHYDALCGILDSEWQPYSGLRDMDEQTELFAMGRTKLGVACGCPGNPPAGKCKRHPLGASVTRARAGQSAHNYGCATDWAIFENGKFYWPSAESIVWKEFEQAVYKAGLKWGGDFNGPENPAPNAIVDCPHAELALTCSWSHVYVEYSRNGMRAAQEKIEASQAK
jgi:hypothetical protein